MGNGSLPFVQHAWSVPLLVLLDEVAAAVVDQPDAARRDSASSLSMMYSAMKLPRPMHWSTEPPQGSPR
jgi:hypothetical protein